MLRLGGVLVGGLMLAAPLSAQEPDHEAAFTPEEDLDCVIYVAALMADEPETMTPESRVALTGAMTYFVGRYEAQREEPLSQALVERYAVYAELDPQAVQQTCAVRARGFSGRLQEAGRAMVERAAEMGQAEAPSGEDTSE